MVTFRAQARLLFARSTSNDFERCSRSILGSETSDNFERAFDSLAATYARSLCPPFRLCLQCCPVARRGETDAHWLCRAGGMGFATAVAVAANSAAASSRVRVRPHSGRAFVSRRTSKVDASERALMGWYREKQTEECHSHDSEVCRSLLLVHTTRWRWYTYVL